ncbi:hypothetical protein SALB1_1065 [Salinisphaera sp. LB1]|nr:hypothetical protein SALB1_1065 [Salinisphaera sp. LB1]
MEGPVPSAVAALGRLLCRVRMAGARGTVSTLVVIAKSWIVPSCGWGLA